MTTVDTSTVQRETEKVLKIRVKEGGEQYLIKWKDLEHKNNTWVQKYELDACAIGYLQKHTEARDLKQNLICSL